MRNRSSGGGGGAIGEAAVARQARARPIQHGAPAWLRRRRMRTSWAQREGPPRLLAVVVEGWHWLRDDAPRFRAHPEARHGHARCQISGAHRRESTTTVSGPWGHGDGHISFTSRYQVSVPAERVCQACVAEQARASEEQEQEQARPRMHVWETGVPGHAPAGGGDGGGGGGGGAAAAVAKGLSLCAVPIERPQRHRMSSAITTRRAHRRRTPPSTPAAALSCQFAAPRRSPLDARRDGVGLRGPDV
ncbi:hypothetical protein K505DRAFT_338803 [Melanomma pulvis-pyrius CBS 109.77]|uniref:Uncharacterized protein n=1 Tax=Melanomma pulvis-pyrius CBS 109.77 TaxID=1314802 RepID=A0A6A6X7S7_9PLEO|nr:hypothetical protein K505DRAFT_338803 [Melanomma pulvis-pyrius CBS 109.77]